MNCKKVNELLARYLEGELGELDRSSIELHIKYCKNCSEEIKSLKQVLELAKLEKTPSPPEDYWASYTARLWQKIESGTTYRKTDKVFAGLAQGTWKDWLKPLRLAIPVFAVVLMLIIYFHNNYMDKNSTSSPVINVPPSMVQVKPAERTPYQSKIVAKTEAEKTAAAGSDYSTLVKLANDIYEFYNPAANTTEVLDGLYAQAACIENTLKEEKDYINLIYELSNEEKQELIAKIQKTLL